MFVCVTLKFQKTVCILFKSPTFKSKVSRNDLSKCSLKEKKKANFENKLNIANHNVLKNILTKYN